MAARFKVLGVSQVAGRGRLLSGEIVNGTIRSGMRARLEGSEGTENWIISGVEFTDNAGARESRVALVFANAPALSDFRARLPVGSVLEIDDAASKSV